MKRLEISRLMDEYVDNEFFPEGGSAADVDAVKARVLAKAAPAKKRRRPLKMALLAAALAVLCLATAGAGLAIIYITSPSDIHIALSEAIEKHDFTQYNDRWLVEEDGRFFLDFGGSRTEITGEFDADTPYIHTVQDQSGVSFYYVVGGTLDNYGYTEFIIVSDRSRSEVNPRNTFVEFDAQGEPILDRNKSLCSWDGTILYGAPTRLDAFDDSYRVYADGDGYILEWRWYSAARDQLGFEGSFSCGGDPLPSIPEF